MKLNFINRLFNWIFPNNKEQKQLIIRIVNAIKDVVESPLADAFVKFTDITSLDNKALTWLRRTLPFILKQLELASKNSNMTQSVSQSVKILKTIKKSDRAGIWQQISGKLYADKMGIEEKVAELEIKQEYDKLYPKP